ncbi:hypothetical protein [Candidatus Similichlamydia epinepheli]|uniref:hypothetical protein n=1 Tax=Candidatus Similichlamydia epinepheli TaxID=1903953 RepID=UPI000D34D5FF|nr:hypothetical protein [Candidatus Similichlamydia epinepheli]
MQGLVTSVHKTAITAYEIANRIEVQFQALPEDDRKRVGFHEQFYKENWGQAIADTIDSHLFREEAKRFFLERSSKKIDEADQLFPSDTKLQSFFIEHLQNQVRLEVSPAKIKEAYRAYLKECADSAVCEYRVLSVSPLIDDGDFSVLVTRLATEVGIDNIIQDSKLSSFCTFSTTYTAQIKSINEDYRHILEKMKTQTFSEPFPTKQGGTAFLFLENRKIFHAKSFQEMVNELTLTLLNKDMQTRFNELFLELRKFQELSRA